MQGGAAYYDDNYKPLWRREAEWRPGRGGEDMFLSLAIKNPTQLVLGVLDRFLLNVEAHPEQVLLVRTARLGCCTGGGQGRGIDGGQSQRLVRRQPRHPADVCPPRAADDHLGPSDPRVGWDASNETRSGGRMTELGSADDCGDERDRDPSLTWPIAMTPAPSILSKYRPSRWLIRTRIRGHWSAISGRPPTR